MKVADPQLVESEDLPEDEEPLDPRIQHELDMMNTSAALINKFENDLVLAQQQLRLLYADSRAKLGSERDRLGSCIRKSMPYYDCRLKAKEAQEQAQEAALKYEKAVSTETAAREMVESTERGYEVRKQNHRLRNMAWQEMLNHSTNKLLVSEEETIRCEEVLAKANKFLSEAQSDVKREHKLNRKAISKSKPYYEMRSKFHMLLAAQEEAVSKVEQDLSTAKSYYSRSMANLEKISMEIHNRRQQTSNNNNSADIENKHITNGAERVTESSPITNGDCLSSSDVITAKKRADNSSPTELVSDSTTHNGSHSTANGVISPDIAAVSAALGSNAESAVTPNSSDDEIEKITSNISSCGSHYDIVDDGEEALPVKRRSGSCVECSRASQPSDLLTKPRSMSVPSSPDKISEHSSGLQSDSTLSSSSSSMLDDQSIDGAVSHTYFDNESVDLSTTAIPTECPQKPQHEDYHILPQRLSGFQRQYTLRRNSVRLSEQELGSMLHLLDNDSEEFQC